MSWAWHRSAPACYQLFFFSGYENVRSLVNWIESRFSFGFGRLTTQLNWQLNYGWFLWQYLLSCCKLFSTAVSYENEIRDDRKTEYWVILAGLACRFSSVIHRFIKKPNCVEITIFIRFQYQSCSAETAVPPLSSQFVPTD